MVELKLTFNTLAECAAFLNSAGGPQPVAAQATAMATPMAGNLPGMAGHVPAMPSAPPATPPAAGPAPQAANGASPSNWTVQTVQPVMQAFMGMFKAAGVKQAFEKHGLVPQLTKLDPQGLATMGDYLQRCVTAGQML